MPHQEPFASESSKIDVAPSYESLLVGNDAGQ